LAFIPIPNGITLCFHFETEGSNWQFCLTLRKSAGAPTPTDLANITGLAETWWDVELQPLLSDMNNLVEIIATDQTSQGAPQNVNAIGTTGGDASASIPLNAAMCISLRTAKRGRSYRGRCYVSGIPQSDYGFANFWTSGAVTDMSDAFNTLINDLDAAGFDVVVASKQHNGVVTTPAETNEVIAITIDTFIDSQRRRLAGRGT